MIGKLGLLAVMTALPAAAIAADLSTTHAPVSVPGKSVHAYRPLAQKSVTVAKCHPEASKAVGCEAVAQRARLAAMAKRDNGEAARPGAR